MKIFLLSIFFFFLARRHWPLIAKSRDSKWHLRCNIWFHNLFPLHTYMYICQLHSSHFRWLQKMLLLQVEGKESQVTLKCYILCQLWCLWLGLQNTGMQSLTISSLVPDGWALPWISLESGMCHYEGRVGSTSCWDGSLFLLVVFQKVNTQPAIFYFMGLWKAEFLWSCRASENEFSWHIELGCIKMDGRFIFQHITWLAST